MWGHCWENNSNRQGIRGGIWQVTRKTEHAGKLKLFEQRADMSDYVTRKNWTRRKTETATPGFTLSWFTHLQRAGGERDFLVDTWLDWKSWWRCTAQSPSPPVDSCRAPSLCHCKWCDQSHPIWCTSRERLWTNKTKTIKMNKDGALIESRRSF